MNVQSICWDPSCSIFPRSNVFAAAWNALALSDVILVAFPRLLVNLLIASKHESVVMSSTTLKCTALVLKQVKMQTYCLVR